METLANGFRASRLGHGRPSNCHFVNINSRKGCRSPSKGHSCTKSATRLTRRTLVAAVASVNAVAEEEETRASNGATPPAQQEEGEASSAPDPPVSAHEASSSTPETSSSGEESLSSGKYWSQGHNPYRAQHPGKSGSGDGRQPGGQQSQQGGGKIWRNPKSKAQGRQPTLNRNSKHQLQFTLDQSLWKSKKQSRKRNTKVENFPYKVGDSVVGTVVGGTNGWRVALDYDPEILGFCSIIELPHVVRDEMDGNLAWQTCKVGLKREFVICNIPEDLQYNGKGPLLSARLLDTDVVWSRAKQLQKICMDDRDSITVNIRTSNTGGVLGCFEGLPLFVPWSFLPRRPDSAIGSKEELVRSTVGKDIAIVVYDVDQQLNRFVGNNVQAMNIKAISALKIGDLAWGHVNNTTTFGAFVTIDNFPSVSALLHIRNVSQVHVGNLEDILRIGDRLRVVVIGVDAKQNRLSLSTAELESYPGEMEHNKEKVFDNAEEAVKGYRDYVAQEQERLDSLKHTQGQGQASAAISHASDDENTAGGAADELQW